MKIRRILSVFLLTVLMVSLMLTPQAYAMPALEIKAKAAVLVDADEGRIIFGQNEQEREYPASITKVMTALLTLEAVDAGKLSLDQPITASAVVNDQDPEGSSAGIEEGEVLTVEQLLYCLLLVSANEAADILAETVSGSREAFVELMNQRAQELGCTGTHFANTNGLHDVNHYTTAYDIYLFFREAMKHETFMTITGSVAYEVPATNKSEARELHTTNSLLSNWRILDYLYDGVDCGKTGSTPEAGYCLVSSCLRDGKRLVAVVLGAEGEGTHIESFSESARLYDYGYNNFSKQLVVSTEDVFRQPVALSKETDCVMLYPAENAEAFLPSDVTKDQLEQTVTLKNEVADAPITRGQEMGTLTISYNGAAAGAGGRQRLPVFGGQGGGGGVPLPHHCEGGAGGTGAAGDPAGALGEGVPPQPALRQPQRQTVSEQLLPGRQKRTLKNDRRAGLPCGAGPLFISGGVWYGGGAADPL